MNDRTAEINAIADKEWLRSFRYKPHPGELTRVQLLIAQLVACGLSDKEMSHVLGVAASTVKAHNGKILKSFGLWRRTQLVRYIFETGQFDPEAVERVLSQRSVKTRRSPDQKSEKSRLNLNRKAENEEFSPR